MNLEQKNENEVNEIVQNDWRQILLKDLLK